MNKHIKKILAVIVVIIVGFMNVTSHAASIAIPISYGEYSGTHTMYAESGYASATEVMAGSTITYLTARVCGTAYNTNGRVTATYDSGTVNASSNFVYADSIGYINNGVVKRVEGKAYFNGILISSPTVTR